MKRTDYINWDEYFMGIALLTAMRSKDPSSQVGACIVSPENKILSLGYNGMPIGCDDDAMPWEREGDPLDTKYMYVCHAELNAILNSAPQQPEGCPGLRDPLPLQRVRQGHHPVRHLRGGVLRRQVPRFRFQRGGAVHVQKGRRTADRLHPPAGGRNCWSCKGKRNLSQNFPLKIQFVRYIIEPSYRINIHFVLHREESIQ